MLFSSFIVDICKFSKVKIIINDERVKNEGSLTVRTIERIAGEYVAAAISEYPTTFTPRKASKIKNMLQELSASINVEAEREENQRLWTYLLHLES